ncbi:DUF2721 domain-containing protein [Ramlibacter sp. AW1]|uniref:DUF2721 domain-containing protein n=1 Tax=Ramlibacter aurantiacus TaxID=2801330 RepID=A0A936ZPX5_9BURK|nr:DUF2721 domain-containing protein [Ramlibacter aurantiacus]MBL0421576.1 DUF2721 domain-containing protein [Ramlibacter aurantiacus]
MAFLLDNASITHGIQLAVAPVFLLTAVAGMIGAVAGRLGRIIDRGRKLEEDAEHLSDPAHLERVAQELRSLRVRGRLSNGCIGLLTTCAFLIGVTIILLFLGEAASLRTSQYAIAGFLLGVVSFLLALLCFLAETLIATRVLNFRIAAKAPLQGAST